MLTYTQLAQHRENSADAVSIYTASASQTVQIFMKITNTTATAVKCSVFHDDDGTTFDESTAIVFEIDVNPGELFEIDHIFINNSTGSLGIQTDTANAITVSVYGIIRNE